MRKCCFLFVVMYQNALWWCGWTTRGTIHNYPGPYIWPVQYGGEHVSSSTNCQNTHTRAYQPTPIFVVARHSHHVNLVRIQPPIRAESTVLQFLHKNPRCRRTNGKSWNMPLPPWGGVPHRAKKLAIWGWYTHKTQKNGEKKDVWPPPRGGQGGHSSDPWIEVRHIKISQKTWSYMQGPCEPGKLTPPFHPFLLWGGLLKTIQCITLNTML